MVGFDAGIAGGEVDGQAQVLVDPVVGHARRHFGHQVAVVDHPVGGNRQAVVVAGEARVDHPRAGEVVVLQWLVRPGLLQVEYRQAGQCAAQAVATDPEVAAGLEPVDGLQGHIAQRGVELEEAVMHQADAALPGVAGLLDLQVVDPVLGGFGAAEHQVDLAVRVAGGEAEGLGFVDVVQLAEDAPDRRREAPAGHVRRRRPVEIFGFARLVLL
ncbi:hypothetical protein D9M68_715640 [compost metagenome]